MRPEPPSTTVRAIVIVAGVYLVGFGLWAFLSPASFFSSIAVFPPYNQHFLHDLGAFQLGLGSALLLTQVWDDSLLAVLAGNALGATIHFAAHIIDRSLGGHPSTDLPFIGGLSLLLIAAFALRLGQLRRQPAAKSASETVSDPPAEDASPLGPSPPPGADAGGGGRETHQGHG